MIDRIAEEDRLRFILAHTRHREALAAVQLAARDVEIERLKISIKYGLSEQDRVDMETGAIARATATSPASSTESPGA